MTLPESWSIQRLDSIASLARGKFSARPRNDPRFFGGDIPFVQTGDVRNAHVYLREFSQTLNADGLTVSRVFPQGTMLFTIAANIGDLAFLAFDAACPDSLVAIEPKQHIDAMWLFYQLGAFKADFEAAATQNAQLNINLEKLNPFKIPCPSLLEQQAIAAALSDADGLVAGLERVIAKKRLIKQGAMQDLLTARRRLPGFSGEWEVKRLGDICRLDMGGTPSRRNSAFWGKGHPWLTIADMQSKVIYTSKEQITEEGAALLTPVKTGTLIMSFKLSIGRLAFAGVDLFTNEAICSFNDLEDDPDFLYYALTTTDFALYGKQAVKGYTLNKQSLKDVEVFMPERKEQQAIAAVLSDMDAEIQTLEARLTKARAVKEGMMQNLLTGRVRLV